VTAGSGLLTQFMLAEESTVGTAVTVTRGYEVDDLKPTNQKITAVSQGLRAGARGHRERNRVITGKSVSLNVPMSVFSKGFGVFLKHALGASSTALIASSTNRQIHLVGDLVGKGLTLQGGFAESGTSGATRAYTYNGCKVTDWELSCRMDDLLKASFGFDGWNWTTATALATASYLSALEVFHWAELTVKIGGTPSTSAGRTTVSGNATVNGLRGVTIRGVNGLRTDRRFAGKHDAIGAVENGICDVGGFRASRQTAGDHGFKHLRGCDHRLACEICPSDDLFLLDGHFCAAHFPCGKKFSIR